MQGLNQAQTPDGTRQQLLLAALALFATHGIAAVPLSRVRDAVGAGNLSVIHYHFHNKSGLVRAVLADAAARLAPLQAEALDELKGIAARGTPTVRDVVAIGFAPFLGTAMSSEVGMQTVRFLSRLTWESGQDAQALLVQTVRPYFSELSLFLRGALPDKPPERLTLHLYLAVNSLIHGLTDISLLSQEQKFGIGE